MEYLNVKQKSPKHSKTSKKKPFKIVYISNPVKFTASPDQFRSVVQRLTGRDSNAADLPGAYDEVTDLSMAKEMDAGLITAKTEIEYQLKVPNRCFHSESGSSYSDFEAVFELLGEKHPPELFMSYDPSRYDTYAEAGIGLSKV